MISIKRELLETCFNDALPLLRAQYEELATFKDIPFSPDLDVYEDMENAGRLRCYTARDDGTILGYLAFFVGFNPHYSTSFQAVNDIVYVDQAHRRGGLGRWLVEYAEEALKKEKVELITFHAKIVHPALQALLVSMGYPMTETVHSKRIV